MPVYHKYLIDAYILGQFCGLTAPLYEHLTAAADSSFPVRLVLDGMR
jgi:hypothetical protein